MNVWETKKSLYIYKNYMIFDRRFDCHLQTTISYTWGITDEKLTWPDINSSPWVYGNSNSWYIIGSWRHENHFFGLMYCFIINFGKFQFPRMNNWNFQQNFVLTATRAVCYEKIWLIFTKIYLFINDNFYIV